MKRIIYVGFFVFMFVGCTTLTTQKSREPNNESQNSLENEKQKARDDFQKSILSAGEIVCIFPKSAWLKYDYTEEEIDVEINDLETTGIDPEGEVRIFPESNAVLGGGVNYNIIETIQLNGDTTFIVDIGLGTVYLTIFYSSQKSKPPLEKSVTSVNFYGKGSESLTAFGDCKLD